MIIFVPITIFTLHFESQRIALCSRNSTIDDGFNLCIGEWFNADPQAVLQQALQTGGGPNASDAHTFNGLPGPLYNCSAKGSVIKFM